MIDRWGRDHALVAASLAAALMLLVACNPTVASPPGTTLAPATPTSSAGPPASPALTDGPVVTPIATPAATSASAAPACALAELKASHGIVEGAAGSRFTTATLVAAVTCSVDAFPALGLRDAAGTILVGAAAGGPGRIELVAGATYTSDVRLGNWCADEPAFPLDLAIIIGGAELPVTDSPFADEGDLPPCNGEGGPILEASAWEAAP